MSAGAIAEFKIVEAAAQRFAKGAVQEAAADGLVERGDRLLPHGDGVRRRARIFRVLFLDRKNGLIADESAGRRAPSTTRRSIRAR